MRDSTAESVKVEPESILGRAGQATALFEALPVGVCVCDASSSAVLWHNQAAERLWGGPPKSMITGDPVLIDRPHGGRVAILGKAAPLRDASGQSVAILNTLEDVTELQHTRAELRELEGWRRLALDTAELGAYDVDFISQRTVCSDRARAILGIPQHVPLDLDLAGSMIH